MRSSLAGSALAHVLLFVALLVVQSRAPRLMIGPEVIQLALLEMPASLAAPAPPAPPADARAPVLAPEPGTGVKITPPKPKTPPRTPVGTNCC